MPRKAVWRLPYAKFQLGDTEQIKCGLNGNVGSVVDQGADDFMSTEKKDEIFFEVRCPGCKIMVCEASADATGDLRYLCRKCGKGRKKIIHLQRARERTKILESAPDGAPA